MYCSFICVSVCAFSSDFKLKKCVVVGDMDCGGRVVGDTGRGQCVVEGHWVVVGGSVGLEDTHTKIGDGSFTHQNDS